jgi:integrase
VVHQTIMRIGNKWKVGTRKSARFTRNLLLVHSGLMTELRRLLLAHPRFGDPDALFWPGRHAHSHVVDYSQPTKIGAVLRYHLPPAAARMSIPPRIRFHGLRHTFASLMLAAGFKPYEVSRCMGHASVSTTGGSLGHTYPTD